MGPIGVSELGDVAHRGEADGAAAAANSGGAPAALRQRSWRGGKGAKGGARGVLVREDERGEEKGQRRQAARF
jgi:hypothetical protein